MKWFMKRVLFMLALLMLALPVAAQSEAAFVRISAERANIRTEPSVTTGQVIATLGQGAQYPVLDQTQFGNWLLIDIGGGIQGWVFRPLTNTYNALGLPVDVSASASVANMGQGGGVFPPLVTTMQTMPATTPQQPALPANLGQGGGFAAPVRIVPATSVTGVLLGTPSLINTQPIALGNINMRLGPSTDVRYFWRVPYGDTVEILGRNINNTWLYVNHVGNLGWVSAQYFLLPVGFDFNSVPVVG